MSIESIVNTLTQGQRLSPAQLVRLQEHQNDSRIFFETLINLYEEKVQRYLAICMLSIKKLMTDKKNPELEIEATESIIAATYSLFTGLNKFSFIQSLRMLLGVNSPDLLISLGLSGKGAKSVFTNYVARYRLFHELNRGDLSALCELMERQNVTIYPSSLFNSFVIETHLSEHANQRISDEPIHQILARQIQNETQIISQGLFGLVSYLADSRHYMEIEQDYRQNYFLHLSSIDTLQRFIQVICNGYINVLNRAEQQQAIQEQTSALIDSRTSQICFPALTLLGVVINLNADHYTTIVRQYDSTITQIKANESTIVSKIEQAKINAYKKIEDERAKVQLPEFTIGFNMHGMPLNLR